MPWCYGQIIPGLQFIKTLKYKHCAELHSHWEVNSKLLFYSFAHATFYNLSEACCFLDVTLTFSTLHLAVTYIMDHAYNWKFEDWRVGSVEIYNTYIVLLTLL